MTFLLDPVGLGEMDSRAFLALLATPRATAAEVADELGVPVDAVRRALGRLVAAGLATRLDSRPTRFALVPPEPAVESLVARRQQELGRLQETIRELAARFTTVPGTNTDLIELIEGGDAVQQHVAELQLTARDEVLMVDAPPYASGRPAFNESELVALARGVRYRSIYHAPVLQDRVHFDQMRETVAAGEQARALPDARMKMLIADGRAAIMPMTFDATGRSAHLLVRSSPMLEAMVGWFESLWDKATPIAVVDGTVVVSEDGGAFRLTDRDRQLLALLASGAKDQAIARALGVTQRTVSRRIADLMTQLSSETRFQAGLQAARLGWF